jgi:D-alanyl-D-alanine carboxypeptidase (penicillin-binding protein 5/6)
MHAWLRNGSVPFLKYLCILREQMPKLHRYISLLLLTSFFCLGLLATSGGPVQARSSTPPKITAQQAYLLDTTTHRRLMKKDAFARVEIASITKVMTALIVLQYGHLNAPVTVQQKYIDYVDENEASTAGLVAGDRLTVKDLLYGLMLPSGCDAAYALAEKIAGSYDAFVALMNKKAKKMGLLNTYYTSIDGLHLPDAEGAYGYSTAFEVVRLSEAAMRYPLFREIVKTANYVLPATDPHKEYTWNNTNRLLVSYEGAIGLKTGTTPWAGPCFLFAATRNGHTLTGVVLNSADVNQRFLDATAILDWGFQQIADGTYKRNESVPAAA